MKMRGIMKHGKFSSEMGTNPCFRLLVVNVVKKLGGCIITLNRVFVLMACLHGEVVMLIKVMNNIVDSVFHFEIINTISDGRIVGVKESRLSDMNIGGNNSSTVVSEFLLNGSRRIMGDFTMSKLVEKITQHVRKWISNDGIDGLIGISQKCL
jgi:hypothetical protein